MTSDNRRIVTLIVALAAILAAAALCAPQAHMLLAALTALVFAVLAYQQNNRLRFENAGKSAISASTARHFAYVWIWGALAILITYTMIIDRPWPEWWQFAIGFSAAGVASYFFANMLAKDAASGKEDEAMLKAGRIIVIVQIIAVFAGLISMFVDGKFPRPVSYADWAGCNIFSFGGLAILVISLNALRFKDCPLRESAHTQSMLRYFRS